MFRNFLMLAAMLAPSCLEAALTPEQRVQDLQTLAGIYAKRYAPANWKIQSLGVNIFDLGPWVRQAREAKSDLEYIEVLMRYVASFQDSHDNLTMVSNFVARLGLSLDLYDGKVAIDLVDRSLLPLRDYPFVAGDEVVSVDGEPALEIARRLQALRGWGNPRAGLRWSVGQIATRGQSTLPRAVELPDESTVVIRRQSGEVESYRMKWVKTGFAVREIGGVPNPFGFFSGVRPSEPFVPSNNEAEDEVPTWRKLFYERHALALSKQDQEARSAAVELENGLRLEDKAVLNIGSRFPWFAFPTTLQQRLGGAFNDVFFSGVYNFDGLRMGYLRIPGFPVFTQAQYAQLDAEMNFMNANTDGLIVDIARNPGGSACAVEDIAARLIPGGYTSVGFSFRPTLATIIAYDNQISLFQTINAPGWAIDLLRFEQGLLRDAYFGGRGMTGAISICSFDLRVASAPSAYRKPMIALIDDFSTSGGDLLPAILQDNKRAKLVGVRSNGAGGSVVDASAGIYSETNTRVTVSLMVRGEEREYPGIPKSPFIENVGVRPDIELDYMTMENLVNQGRPYSEAFSRILAEEIRKAQP